MAQSHASKPDPTHTAPAAPMGHSHGAEADHAHVAAHVMRYLVIGGILIVCTGLTVWLSYVDFGSRQANIIVAMIVATFKAGLVAAIFMHLWGERAIVWRVLFFTFVFVTGMFFLTLLHWWDPIMGSLRNHH